MTLRTRLLTAAGLFLLAALPARPYSLLTHEQLIDLTWQRSIVPLLLSRYPGLTPAQLDEARAYAYGGCVIQDIGYYPFGDTFFSDLTHYVRTGDFVVALFRNAHNADELAFAVGALSHYIGDSIGHPDATNVAVPVEFPKLGARYGSSVSYGEGPRQHVQTEFAFDINEISHHRMAPVHYLRHIGLMVPTTQLAQAFYETYGLGEDFTKERSRRINVRAYRFAVHSFIPRIAYAINLLHRSHEPTEMQSADRLELNREIAEVEARDDWATYRRSPGFGTHLLAGVIYILPKFGPLKLAAIKGPTQATDQQYAHSVLLAADTLSARLDLFTPRAAQTPEARLRARNAVPLAFRNAAAPNAALSGTSTLNQAPASLASASPAPAAQTSSGSATPGSLSAGAAASGSPVPLTITAADPAHPLPDRDLDTGKLTTPGTYRLTDQTFAALLHRLALAPTNPVPATIKQTITAFYGAPNAQLMTRSTPAAWSQIQRDLTTLATIPLTREFDPLPTYPDDPDPAVTPTPATASYSSPPDPHSR